MDPRTDANQAKIVDIPPYVLRIAEEAFAPFLKQLGFAQENPSVSGRFHEVRFTSSTHCVLVSYEPSDEQLFVMVFTRTDDELSDVDDRAMTPRLSDLNRRYMATVAKEDRTENATFFDGIAVHDREAERLLEAAKDLRLVLPRYLRSWLHPRD